MMAPLSASAALLAIFLTGNPLHQPDLLPPLGARYHRAICKGHGHHCLAHHLVDRNGKQIFFATQQGYGADDLASAYKLDTSLSPGATIAVVDAYNYTQLESDLGVYRSNYGLPACTKANGCLSIVNQQGKTSPMPSAAQADCQNGDWTEETALDVQMASAACPKCKLLVVLVDDDQDMTNLFEGVSAAASLGATVISNSWGAAEGEYPSAANGKSAKDMESYMNHPGIAIFVAAGDDGYNDGGSGPDYPGTSAYVSGVGGTTLNQASNSRGWTETAWSDTGQGGAGGSACSLAIPKPSWQTASPCGYKATADVSAVADMQIAIYNNGPSAQQCGGGGWTVIGGTSAASPLVAGIYALTGNGAQPPSFAYAHTSAFFDVTSGNNGSCGSMTLLCNAKAGWDGPTGVGTPNGALLATSTGSPNGSTCSGDAICQSGHCVSSICCDTTCTGPCQSCSTGTCTPLTGSSCDDGNLCTTGDTCSNGSCVGTPVDCGPATGECQLAPTCNPATGACSAPAPAPNGTACDDNNACTENDACNDGVCQGTPSQNACPADACHEAGTCDVATGQCNATPKPDGTSCDDGEPCTENDVCTSGVCKGTTIQCPPPDACHMPGACVPGLGCYTGFPNAPNGTPCDDGNACTTNDSCLSGVCTGTPVDCSESVCRTAGQCDPSTGKCNGTPKADGTACNDGNGCTNNDQCVSGECQGTATICADPQPCHEPGQCNWQTGICVYPLSPNGTACDDGDPDTTGDSCQNGHCAGSPLSTPTDCSGLADGTACSGGACKSGTCVSSTTPPSNNGSCGCGSAGAPLPMLVLGLGALLLRRRRPSLVG